MANSRLEKIGTIFSRTKGLLKSGAMKPHDKPIWFEVYTVFPPHQEPRFDRPTPNIPLRPIFYEEDQIRAKFQRQNRNTGTYNLGDHKTQTHTQAFIEAYNNIKNQGALAEDSIFEAAQDAIGDRFQPSSSSQHREPIGLVKSFSDAQKEPAQQQSTVDVKNIFD